MLQILKNIMNSCVQGNLSFFIPLFQQWQTHTYTLSSPPTVTMHSEQPRGLKFASIASPCCGWLSGMLLHSLTISRTNGSFSICSRKQLESNPETHSADITSFMWTCGRGQKGWRDKKNGKCNTQFLEYTFSNSWQTKTVNKLSIGISANIA